MKFIKKYNKIFPIGFKGEDYFIRINSYQGIWLLDENGQEIGRDYTNLSFGDFNDSQNFFLFDDCLIFFQANFGIMKISINEMIERILNSKKKPEQKEKKKIGDIFNNFFK